MAAASGTPREPGWAPDPGTAREEAERLVATAIGAASMAARRIGRTRGPVSSSPLGEALPPGLGTLADALVDSARSAFGMGHNPAHYRVANGSPECCVCPVCRAIAAVRDPSPQAAERLATGAGDLAAGVASFLRAVAGTGSDRAAANAERPEAGEPGPAWPAAEEPTASGAVGDVWRAATRDAGAPPGPRPAPQAQGPKPPGPDAGPESPAADAPARKPPGPEAPARKPMAKKAVKPAARKADGEGSRGEASRGEASRGEGPAGRGDEGR